MMAAVVVVVAVAVGEPGAGWEMRGRPIDAAFPKRALDVTGAGAGAVAGAVAAAAVLPVVDAVGDGIVGVVAPQAAAMSTLDGTFFSFANTD